MSWVAVGVAGTALVTSYMNNQAKKKQDQRAGEVSAAQTEYSPWTHITPQQYQPQATQSDFGAAFGGASQGALAGMQMRNQMQSQPQMQQKPTMMQAKNYEFDPNKLSS